MKQRTFLVKISFLFLQSVLCVLLSLNSSSANVADSKSETTLTTASNSPVGQLLFASGPAVPVAATIAKYTNFSGQGFYHKDVSYPGSSLTHAEKSFLIIVSKKPSVLQKQHMRLHLACCALLI